MSLTHAHLPGAARQVYDLLADHPGPATTAAPVAAALGITEPDAAAALQRLHAAHLVDQLPPGHRYALTSLVRQHAAHQRRQTPASARAVQNTRLVSWYTAAASAAVSLVAPRAPWFSAHATHEALPPDHADGRRGLPWYAQEHHVLRNILAAELAQGRAEVAVELAEAVWHLARPTYHHDDLAHAQHTGHTLTHQTRRPLAAVFRAREATALADLGRRVEALRAAAEATTSAQDTAEPGILALVHAHNGRVHLTAGQPENALHELATALRHHQVVDDDHGRALVHRRIGQAHLDLGHIADATRYLDASSSALTRKGHRLSAARSLTYLAHALVADRHSARALSVVGRAHDLLGNAAAPRYRAGIGLAAARARYALGEATVTRRITEDLIRRLRDSGPGAAGDLAAATELHNRL
ncbi:hypothetical protein ACIOD2_47240 [Amycolatopsis sp. NPDC088138]|uniref:hypothetical protein n=1 Tax=Amycolatopsis sp. NPDC088138 TaxID=3363938 RepID=UPI003801A043